MVENRFTEGLTESLPELVRAAPKSDLHNHAALGSRLEHLEQWAGQSIPKAPDLMMGLSGMDEYLHNYLLDIIMKPSGFEYAIGAAFRQAVQDGIQVLQMSFDLRFFMEPERNPEQITQLITRLCRDYAPDIRFIPQLGIDRALDPAIVRFHAEKCIESGWFRSIDLYGDELAGDLISFKPVYRLADRAGLGLTAHAGESGTADDVKRTVETLGATEIQHGIALAASPGLMNWARDNNLQLNICPSSNVRLSLVESLKTHPIRILYDHGIRITVNTDDLMIFGQSVSDEFINLYRAGTFSAQELDDIRRNGLAKK